MFGLTLRDQRSRMVVESNVIERLWKQMHDPVTRNHQHHTSEALLLAVERSLVAAQPFPGTRVSTLRLLA